MTCAHDVEKGRSTFEEIAAGEPLTQEMLQPVLALHDEWKEAEAAFQQALRDVALRNGRNVKSIAAVVHHARKGHRLTRPI